MDDGDDELRSEYDLKRLRVRRLGAERSNFGETTIRLAPEVAAMFPDADAVNEALRFLIRVMHYNRTFIPKPQAPNSNAADR